MEDLIKVEADAAPICLEDIFADLQGFGVEEIEEVLTITSGTKSVKIKLSNMPVDDDLTSILAVEDTKGYTFFQSVKVEILSRSISWINGVNIRALSPAERIVVDPKDKERKDIQVILRSTIRSWGLEVMQVLWKALMVHSQRIEDRLFESFPEVSVMTEVERRYRERIERELEEMVKESIQKGVAEIFDDKPSDEQEQPKG